MTRIMGITLAALVPGIAIATWHFGFGIAINVLVAAALAAATEAVMLTIRKLPLSHLRDGSAVLTGALLGIALPPLLPYWMLALGVILAIVLGKHVYGGLGHNLFNPAMVGFAALILSFPLAMNQWPAPGNAGDALAAKATLSATGANFDGVSRATPLDAYKFRRGETNDEYFTTDKQADWLVWVQINIAFLLGGLALIYLGVIGWQVPVTFLVTLAVLSLLFHDGGSSASLGSPAFHLLGGATMLAAFFILTDPVTSPAVNQGLIFYAAGAAIITFAIRTVGAYPEGVAFATLLMNGAAPLIDHLLTRHSR